MMNVFVYGTLMFKSVAEPIAGLVDAPVDASLAGYCRYTIEDRERAKVPTIVEEEGGVVVGKIYRNANTLVLDALDNFEDLDSGQYVRRTVQVSISDGAMVEAETYVAGPRARAHLGGLWDPVLFEKNELEYYVETVVPKYALGR